MNELQAFPLLLLSTIAVAAAVAHALVRRVRGRRHLRREQGWRLIHELKAHSAWVESLYGQPLVSMETEELAPAQALREAGAIARAHFPQLGPAMLRLLQADNQLMRHLWEQKLLRLGDPGDWTPCRSAPRYRELREAQEDLIDAIIARCNALIGGRGRPWRNAGTGSEFFSSMGVSSGTCR